jgi:hypothetical protein
MNLARPFAVLLCLPVLGALAGCGANNQPEQRDESYQSVNAQVAETEGIYLEIEEMKYQVQISKQLNPGIVHDRDYLSDLSPADARLARDEEWFAVFLRVENEVDEGKPNAVDFEVRDTQENVYRPVRFGPDNPWAYRPTVVPPKELYPLTNSPAGERPPYAALLLFKVRRFSLDNRPLELIITGREGQQGIVNLDV